MTRTEPAKSDVQEPVVLSYDTAELSTLTVFTGTGPSAPSSRRLKTSLKQADSRRTVRRLAEATQPTEPEVHSYDAVELSTATVFAGGTSLESSRRVKKHFARTNARDTVRRLATR
jgi:hypothetical protein